VRYDFENETNILFPRGVPDRAVMAVGNGNESIFKRKPFDNIIPYLAKTYTISGYAEMNDTSFSALVLTLDT